MATAPQTSGEERRAYRRVRLKVEVRYRTEDPNAPWQTAVTRDVSASGLLIETSDCFHVSTRLVMLFSVPKEKAPRQITTVVMRSEFDEEHRCYLAGVRFTNLDEATRRLIDAALDHTDIVGLLKLAAQANASDVHLSTNQPPMARIAGALKTLRREPISGPDLKNMIYTLMNERQRQAFERDLELNFSVAIEPTVRYRVNVHSQRGNVEAALRCIEPAIRTVADLNLPAILERFADLHDGLVLITGPTGAGKTTTVAALVNHINATRTYVVIMLENPIEYIHTFKKSVIKQREIGIDTHSYPVALREAMRQDPDVIVVGEVRDDETMKTALDAAETGHLVLATFPAANCTDAILRVTHFFPKDRQGETCLQLANCLRAIVSLRLVPRSDGQGVIPATEVLINTFAVSNTIRTGTLEQISSIIQTNIQLGMHSMESSLERLHRDGRISAETVKLQSASMMTTTAE